LLCDSSYDVRHEQECAAVQQKKRPPLRDGADETGGIFWWSAPEKIQLEPFPTYSRTEQRQILLREKLLDGAAAKEAKNKIAEWKHSGQPTGFYNDRTSRPEIEL
jgi:hypothetical protein